VTILAIDTTSDEGSIAIRREGKTVYEAHIQSSGGFAHLIFFTIWEALSEGHIRLEEIDCFAAASGPGAFTGIRVGLAAVKGLAEALGKQAAGVSTLRAMAAGGTGERRAVILDARRGQVFAAVYGRNDEAIAAESVSSLEQWVDALEVMPDEIIARAEFRRLLENTRLGDVRFAESPRNLAVLIAACAERDFAAGCLPDVAAIDANYVRRSDAELFWKDPQ
jgi:tRNA threonylcarbamoyladenosine biosynthesis protein TsaB